MIRGLWALVIASLAYGGTVKVAELAFGLPLGVTLFLLLAGALLFGATWPGEEE